MSYSLTSNELAALVKDVFKPAAGDTGIAVLSDLPRKHEEDNPAWKARREMAARWTGMLREKMPELGLVANLILYESVGKANADLPRDAWIWDGTTTPSLAGELDGNKAVPMENVLKLHSIVIAPTEYSTTAPLKLCAGKMNFRAATMPGFTEAMIPMLRLDYVEINRRVERLKKLCDAAVAAEIHFSVKGKEDHRLILDLRHRTGHASGGLFPQRGMAGNLPSGEAYIVPYEGEIPGDPSGSAGSLPVQIDGEIVVFRIEGNRAVEVLGEGPVAAGERRLVETEPAYCNLAELGFGVLQPFGIKPLGNILSDEKLGLHIAFGRSDHFGGTVGPKDFSSPEAVIHLDRVFIREMQPDISVVSVLLKLPGDTFLNVIRNDQYVLEF